MNLPEERKGKREGREGVKLRSREGDGAVEWEWEWVRTVPVSVDCVDYIVIYYSTYFYLTHVCAFLFYWGGCLAIPRIHCIFFFIYIR